MEHWQVVVAWAGSVLFFGTFTGIIVGAYVVPYGRGVLERRRWDARLLSLRKR